VASGKWAKWPLHECDGCTEIVSTILDDAAKSSSPATTSRLLTTFGWGKGRRDRQQHSRRTMTLAGWSFGWCKSGAGLTPQCFGHRHLEHHRICGPTRHVAKEPFVIGKVAVPKACATLQHTCTSTNPKRVCGVRTPLDAVFCC
jgi:hypothetical protein